MSGLLAGDPAAVVWLLRLLAALGAALGVGVGVLLVHHAASRRRQARRLRQLEGAATALAPYLAGRPGAAAAVARASRVWGRPAVAATLRRARRLLAGEHERAISRLLEEMGEARRLARRAARGAHLGRARALRELAACGGPRARRELLRATAARRRELRRVAREGLLELRDPFAVRAAVAAFLAEPAPTASWSRSFLLRLAIYAPGELRRLAGDRTLPPPLEKLALEALAESGDPAAAPLALRRLQSPAGELRAAAVRLLGAIGDGRWTAPVTARLDDRQWYVRAAAARALGDLPRRRQTTARLAAALGDGHWWVRANAARSLARMGPAGMHRLARAAAGTDGGARQAALPELLRLDEAHGPAAGGIAARAGLALAS